MELRKFLTVLTIVLVILLSVLIWFFPSNDDFHTENPFWNGARDISLNLFAEPLASLSDLPSPSNGSTLILIPYESFSTRELEKINTFVTQGGTLVLADDYGWGNQILSDMGLKARFSGQPLLDPLSNYKNKWLPRIFQFKSSPFTANVNSLVLNHATGLTNIETNDTLALSSSSSFLDMNNNETWDGEEPVGPLPVISLHQLGSGKIVLVSDPSLFINSMETMGDNLRLIGNLASTASSGLFIDQSHLPPSSLHQTKDLLANLRSLLTTPTGTFGLALLALLISLIPIWYRRNSILVENHGK